MEAIANPRFYNFSLLGLQFYKSQTHSSSYEPLWVCTFAKCRPILIILNPLWVCTFTMCRPILILSNQHGFALSIVKLLLHEIFVYIVTSIQLSFFPLPNRNQHRPKILTLLQKCCQTLTIHIRSGGIRVGVISNDLPLLLMQRHIMRPIFPLSTPGIGKHTHIGTSDHFIKFLPAKRHLDPKTMHFKKYRKAPKCSTKITV